MYSILREHKDRNADSDQNAGSTIWDFYGTQEVIKLQIDPICWKTWFSFRWSVDGFHLSFHAHDLKAEIFLLAILLGAVMTDRGAVGSLPE